MATTIDGELARPGLRVRAAWMVLAVATLIKAACAAGVGWVAWKAAVTMAALSGMLQAPRQVSRSAGGDDAGAAATASSSARP